MCATLPEHARGKGSQKAYHSSSSSRAVAVVTATTVVSPAHNMLRNLRCTYERGPDMRARFQCCCCIASAAVGLPAHALSTESLSPRGEKPQEFNFMEGLVAKGAVKATYPHVIPRAMAQVCACALRGGSEEKYRGTRRSSIQIFRLAVEKPGVQPSPGF